MTTVVVVQVFQAQASRSSKESVFQFAPLSDPGRLAATSVLLALQALVIYTPQPNAIFGTAALTARQTMVPLVAGLFVFLVVAGVKLIRRRAHRMLEE